MSKNKNATLIALFLMFTMAVSLFAMPKANAQSALIMNVPTKVAIHSEVDIDLNGGPGAYENVSLFVKYPGDSAFTYIDTYLTRSNGDLDVYDFDFNEVGVFELKWAYPSDSPYYPGESTVVNVQVVLRLEAATYAFIGALPNPVGVEQEVLLHIGITAQLNAVAQSWEGLSVTIERPDGKTETISDVTTDSTGGTGRIYIPDIEGTYYLQTHFPEQETTNDKRAAGWSVGTWMLASDSEKLALVVQADPIPYYPTAPLPTEFWTRPINAQLREWANVSGSNWMDDEYNEAPESPHVLWTKVLTIGGLAGGEIGEHSMEHGDAYEGKWPTRLILAGKLYYEAGPYERPRVYHCVDVRTGEELWSRVFLDNRSISMGQLLYWDNFNYHGVFSYLWVTVGSDWHAFHPLTGEWIYTMTDVPSGSNIIGPSGEICRYSVSTSGGYMTLWNSTICGLRGATGMQAGSWGSRVSLREIDASSYGLQWNITIPEGLSGSVRGVKLGDRVVGVDTSNAREEVNIWGFSLEEGREGNLLFNKAWKFPTEWIEGTISFLTYGTSWALTDLDARIGLIWVKEFRKHYAFSLETGDFLWEQEIPQTTHLDIYSIGRRIEYGRLYAVGQAGQLHCFNATNGKLLWIYNATDPYTEFLWGNSWSLDIQFISKEKIYMFHSEHSPINPLFRGAPAICLNATTGEEIWRVNGLVRKTDWGGSPIMGDSVIAMYNSYDQRVYAIGKGPSATTVSAAPKFSVEGDSVLVEGMVTDVSPGTNDLAITMRFPSGVPAVSDESQGEWMKHVYAQFERPADVTGVEVTISVLDPNNNSYDVGTATTDASGTFCCEFTPEVPGLYTVIATFEGSGAYYGSYAETYLKVNETPTATPTPTPSPAPITDMYVTGFGIGMIIAIVVVGLLLFLMLRKR